MVCHEPPFSLCFCNIRCTDISRACPQAAHALVRDARSIDVVFCYSDSVSAQATHAGKPGVAGSPLLAEAQGIIAEADAEDGSAAAAGGDDDEDI